MLAPMPFGSRHRTVWLRLLAALILWASGPSLAHGQERVFATFGQAAGLTAPPIWALAQDSVGFIWVGAEGGLFRFDGSEFRRWAPETISTFVMDVAVSPDGDVVVLDGGGRLYRVEGNGVRAIELPWPRTDSPRRPGRMIAFDTAGALWLRYGDAVGRLGPDGWHTLEAEAFDGAEPLGLVPAGFGGAFVITARGLWRVAADEPPRRLAETDAALGDVFVGASEPEPGRVLVLSNVRRHATPRVLEARNGTVRELVGIDRLPSVRAISIRERNGTIWVAADVVLVAVRPGEEPEIIGPDEGFESGGPLLVDREGSLWLGSFLGLHQYPEPDTRLWAERQGLPSRHARFLARSDSVIWVMTWSGPGTIHRSASGWRARTVSWNSRSHICTTPDGRAWTGSGSEVMEIRGDSVRSWPGLPGPIHGCAAARHGGVWLGGMGGLAYIDADRGIQRSLDAPFPDEPRDPRPALLHDARDRVWVGAGESLCHAPAGRVLAGEQGLWTCQSIATSSGAFNVAELDEGRLWASAGPAGLLAYDGDAWTPLRVEGAPTQTVHALVPSPRGGVWIVGHGMVARARPGADGRPEFLERLTAWHGIGAESASHLLEEPAGDLWLATNRGAAHVPAAVRFGQPPLPTVALVEGRVDERPIALGEALVLPHDRNRIELRFAALSYRHRAGLRHQVRLSPDEPWSESTGEPAFRWVDLAPGTYHAQYRVSRDGGTWSPVPAGFSFHVEPPWYATPWFLVLVGMAGAVVAAVLYRARVGYLLGLERQRTRIAMDLHDHVGSGLASVGILSGVVAADDLEASERQRTAREIADVAEELGHSLSDIVWALDPQTASLEELATRLAEHGERLFPDDDVIFEARLPARWPPVTSSVAVRRGVLLIGLEALHNAARHAGARTVTLAFTPHERRTWELSVHDDGTGIPLQRDPSPGRGNGRGLAGMDRRARAIGGRLDIDTGPGLGTSVILRFRPHEGRIPGLWSRLTASARAVAHMIMRRRSRA